MLSVIFLTLIRLDAKLPNVGIREPFLGFFYESLSDPPLQLKSKGRNALGIHNTPIALGISGHFSPPCVGCEREKLGLILSLRRLRPLC